MRSVLSVSTLLRRSFQSEAEVAFVLRHLKSSPSSAGGGRKSKSSKSPLHDLLISMPKEAVHVPLLQSQRAARKEVTSKFPAGYINLEVLGNGAKGAPAALYVFTDQTRYLFNCGEGTQRLAHEHKMKLAKLEHIFLTSSSWDKMGGLPGVALTIQDIGIPSITLHGPPGLEDLFEGTRRFVILKDLQIRVADCCSGDGPGAGAKFYEDHVMRIDYVPLLPSTTRQTSDHENGGAERERERLTEEEAGEADDIDYYAPIKGCKRNLQIEGRPNKKGRVEGPSEEVVSYICRPKPKAGALMIEKCLEYGVPSGPLLGQLKRGEDVTLSNGRVVKAASVRSPDAPTTTFIVVDCPTEAYLESLTSNEELGKFQGDSFVPDDFVHVVVHFTPKQVLTHPSYLEWMAKFRLSTKHLLLNDLCRGMGSEAVHRAQFQLNQLDSEMFPILHGQDLGQAEQDGELTKAQLQIIYGTSQVKFQLRPRIGLDTSSQVLIKGADFVSQLMALPHFPAALDTLRGELRQFGLDKPNPPEFPKFTFLGTGSCIPNKTRNVSGILLRVSDSSSILLDCGEGTYGQLVRFFGADEVENVLVHLNGIYISHLHADHHLGLINLLQRREAAFQRRTIPFRPLFLVAPHQIQSWLLLYSRRFEPLRHLYELIPTTSLLHLNSALNPTTEGRFYEGLGLKRMETVTVRHCPNAYGVSLTGRSGWKVTYSGDTMPSDYLVTLGKGSDLLIHEATMEDELKAEAVLKMHSTVSEAIGIGRKMGAKFTMLTHFSQRYAKVPKISGDLDPNVGIAFDNMSLGLSDLWKVPLMYPTLKSMFAEHCEEMETKTAKKLRRKEREKEREGGPINTQLKNTI